MKDAKMMPLPDNTDVVCYFVTKHSQWRGKYKRIFSIGTCGITTYNPTSLEVTNRWLYVDVLNLKPLPQGVDFTITARKDGEKKIDTMRFSTEHRSQLLTYAFRYLYAEKSTEKLRYEAFKYHWSGTQLPVALEVTAVSLDQLDLATNQVLASYCFKDIEALQYVSDVPGGFVIISSKFGRMHCFTCPHRDEIKKKIQENANFYVGIKLEVKSDTLSLEDFTKIRFGNYSDDEYITSMSEFNVQKVDSDRHSHGADAPYRLLCLSYSCLVERDPQSYNIATLRPLADIMALVRSQENPQLFRVEYADGGVRSYMATNRDALLATLLDGVRGSGNRDVHVKSKPTALGKRWGPLHTPLEEEVEGLHMKYFQQPPARLSFSELVERFNCNVPYSGLLHSVTQEGLFAENKEKLITHALQALVQKEWDTSEIWPVDIEAYFQALRRLIASKTGFAAFSQITGFREKFGNKVIQALRLENEAVTHAAIDTVCALMHPMYGEYDLRQEQLNKSSLLSNHKFLENLLDMWINYVNTGTGALVVTAMLDMLTFALCVPYSETTEGKHFDALLEMVAARGRSLFKHFQHPSLTVIKGAGLVMRAVIEEGDAEVATRMQDLALSEGALLRHLLTALFTRSTEQRMLLHKHLSNHLVGLWVTGNEKAMSLLYRMMPAGLLIYLESDEVVPDEYGEDVLITRDNLKLAQDHASRNQRNPHLVSIERHVKNFEKRIVEQVMVHWGTALGVQRKEEKPKDRPVVLRKRRERIKSVANWSLFYYKFHQDIELANLIWNHKTREELREALENEVRYFVSGCELAGNTSIAWNHSEFEIQYHCLSDEVCIDGYYLRLLLEKNTAPESLVKISHNFFNNLYHRFILAGKTEMKCMCLQAMSIVYERYHSDIGPFSDTKFIVTMLERCLDKKERDRLLVFIEKLILNKSNVKALIDANGVSILVELLALAHLHTNRAVVPTQNIYLEAGHDMSEDNQKEWYYTNGDKREGPISFRKMAELYKKGTITARTKCWAAGISEWRFLQNIPQLKWCLVAKGSPVFNESELACLILNIFIKMCGYYPSRDKYGAVIWPLPRIKRELSDAKCLPHVVQLLLTFDPVLVEKVAALLCEISEDNAHASELYKTGVFYFILMYTGSNVLPIAKFLQLTHTKQAFRGDEVQSSELMQRSVLGQLLPEAMVHYLENHGSAMFAQIFLGEFDTPEAIWNSEMRRLLIEKIALHISDFTPRLRGNNRALYEYCSIPVVRYPQLQKELFCNIFYLRHLCDVQRFPDWPIKEPVKLLKDILEAWKAEVEKKPPAMSVDDAFEALGLQRGQHHPEPVIRKAYYRLAQKLHPDKNPQGREQFVLVNKAHEFLCSRSSWADNGPNPDNIVLILQSQSILFHRYSTDLQPYKYAGYKLLIKTIQLETADSQLFSKSAPLLLAATELAYHTVNCSALNAEELNREGGFQVLLAAFSRCVSMLNRSTEQKDMVVQVCSHCTRCFTVAAQFSACRNTFVEMPQLIEDVTRILHFKNLPKLCCEVAECVSSLSVDTRLQHALLHAGVLWHLLIFLFNYDFTLEDCGVERSEDANNQELLNRLAKLSVKACAKLGGYLSGDGESPNNPVVRQILERLLTPFLASQFSSEQPEKLLKFLTSNTENPYLLWNNSTRIELLEFLEKQATSRVEHQVLEDITFKFSSHSKELIIGNVFIRVYNLQPTFQIENGKGFLLDLLEFIRVHQPRPANDIPSNPDQLKRVTMALHSLSNVIVNNPGLEMQCIGHFRLLFPLLSLDGCHPVQSSAMNVIAAVTKNQECINDIAATDVLVHLLLVLHSLPDKQPVSLDILHALTTSPAIVKDFLTKGGFIYLLNLMFNSSVMPVRVKSAELLGKLCADKLSGPVVRLKLGLFLPPAICDALRDSPAGSVQLLETNQENPELIWDEECRKQVSRVVADLTKRHYAAQRVNHNAGLKLPEDVVSGSKNKEVIVGGVYLRLFNKNPGWVLRKPKEFLSELLDTSVKEIPREPPNFELLDLVVTALLNLLQAHPNLADQVPAMGHIPRLCAHMSANSKPHVPRSVVRILHQLAISEVCICSLGQTDVIGPLKTVMQEHSDLVPLGCDTMARLFLANKDQLVKQALNAGLVPYFLNLLDGQLEYTEHGARSKALIVKSLKSMCQSTLHGTTITNMLERSQVWAAYSEQNHDLFITGTSSQSYLTGVPASAGYLTQGSAHTVPNSPPPIDKEESR